MINFTTHPFQSPLEVWPDGRSFEFVWCSFGVSFGVSVASPGPGSAAFLASIFQFLFMPIRGTSPSNTHPFGGHEVQADTKLKPIFSRDFLDCSRLVFTFWRLNRGSTFHDKISITATSKTWSSFVAIVIRFQTGISRRENGEQICRVKGRTLYMIDPNVGKRLVNPLRLKVSPFPPQVPTNTKVKGQQDLLISCHYWR